MTDRKLYPDGREVLNRRTRAGRLLYLARLQEMTERQGGRCGLCGKREWDFITFDHQDGRGMGGSKQDDRIELLDGTWQNAALCMYCNLRKGSRRVEYLPFARRAATSGYQVTSIPVVSAEYFRANVGNFHNIARVKEPKK